MMIHKEDRRKVMTRSTQKLQFDVKFDDAKLSSFGTGPRPIPPGLDIEHWEFHVMSVELVCLIPLYTLAIDEGRNALWD